MRGTLVDLRPLGVAPFRRFWIGSAITATGGTIGDFAVLLYVWQVTGSAAWTGTVALVRAIPSVIGAMIGGPVADRMDRRTVLLASVVAQMLLTAVMAAMVLSGSGWLLPLIVVLGLRAAASSVAAPARQAVAPTLLPPERLAAGIALLHMAFQVAILAGPGVAGLLTAGLGVGVCLVVDAASFLGGLYGVLGLPAMRADTPTEAPKATDAAAESDARQMNDDAEPLATVPARRPWHDVLDGLPFVLRHPVLRACLLADLAATVLAMPVALFPAVNEARFGGSPQTLGLLLPAVGVGGLLASLLSGRTTRTNRPGVVMIGGGLVWSVGLLGFAFAPSLELALLALCLAGMGDMVSVVARGTMVQLATPDRLRGRVNAVDYVAGAIGPDVGNFRGGLVAEAAGLRFALISGAVASGAGIAVVAALSRSLRGFRALSEPHPATKRR